MYKTDRMTLSSLEVFTGNSRPIGVALISGPKIGPQLVDMADF
jgi:hypothetical protein